MRKEGNHAHDLEQQLAKTAASSCTHGIVVNPPLELYVLYNNFSVMKRPNYEKSICFLKGY